MKKILGLLFFALMLQSCDDGDMTIETIDFTDVAAASCGETIYKLNGNEALYIKIPASENAFANEVTPVGSPDPIAIGGNVSVTYRAYNGTVTGASICNTPGPISPVATEEWIATSGRIEIATIAVYSAPDAVTGAVKIQKYIHNIVLKDVVFAKPSGTQIYETFPFGEYTTQANSLSLDFDPEAVALCPTNNVLYNVDGIEAMFIQNLDPALLSTADLGVAKTALISSTSNNLTFRLFKTALTTTAETYFCNGTLPTTPEINEEWVAVDGVSGVSGIIEVTTTTNGPNAYLHTIRLKAVTFKKGNSTFYLGNSILYGQLLTTI